MVLKLSVLIIVFCGGVATAQEPFQLHRSYDFPIEASPPVLDEPQPQPLPEKKCGPRWMGGCWKYEEHNQPWATTFKSKKFWPQTLAITVSAAFDYATTDYFSKNGHYLGNSHNGACWERNSIIGNPPSPAGYAKDFALTHVPVIVLGAAMTKAKFPHWIYDGMAAYVVGMHARGAAGWYQNCR